MDPQQPGGNLNNANSSEVTPSTGGNRIHHNVAEI